jgi:hypothetical protein
MAGDVAQHDGQPSVRKLEEVVDVAADLDVCRRLVHGPELEARKRRRRAREQRALDRVGEVALLLVQARVVERERGLARDGDRGLDRVVGDRPSRVEREERERTDGVLIGTTAAVDPYSRNGTSSS